MSKKQKAKRAAKSARSEGPRATKEGVAAAAPAVTPAVEAFEQFHRKAAQQDGARKNPARRQDIVHRRRKLPDWPLLALALGGLVLAGYLTGTAWFGAKLAYCGTGSGCDTVQSSRWATLLGAPTALWGFLAYAALGWIAWRVKDPVRRWRAAWFVALVSLGVSLYLTAVSLIVLQAGCFYCLASLALVAAITILLALQGRRVPGIAWRSWLGQGAGIAAVAVVLLHLHYSGVFTRAAGPEDPYLQGLAERLKNSGAQFYGASWCPHCQEQKEMFEGSASRLPYIECSPNGPQGPANPVCLAQDIGSYPTWVFPDGRHTGTLRIDELASRTGYPARPRSP